MFSSNLLASRKGEGASDKKGDMGDCGSFAKSSPTIMVSYLTIVFLLFIADSCLAAKFSSPLLSLLFPAILRIGAFDTLTLISFFLAGRPGNFKFILET